MNIASLFRSNKTGKKKDTQPQHLCNLDKLEGIARGNPQLLKQLISMYLEAAELVARTIPLQYAQSDLPGLHTTLHKFVSSVKIFGIEKLADPINKMLDQEHKKGVQKVNTDALIAEICYFNELSQQEMRKRICAL